MREAFAFSGATSSVVLETTKARLALGTVQFGLPYGLVPPNGLLSHRDIAEILSVAWHGGIDVLDTAVNYGKAHEIIGKLRPAESRFAIVSKTPSINGDRVSRLGIEKIRKSVHASLKHLGVDALEGLLVHHATDLLVPGGSALFQALEELRAEGIVRRIGVSIYDSATLNRILGDYPVEIVQLPINVLDQRLVRDGTLTNLARRGIEVHARSVFLQGVLLVEPERLPARFASIRKRLSCFQSGTAAAGVSPLVAALGFVAHCPGISRIVLGVNTASNLRDNLRAFAEVIAGPTNFDVSSYAIDDLGIIDPRQWS